MLFSRYILIQMPYCQSASFEALAAPQVIAAFLRPSSKLAQPPVSMTFSYCLHLHLSIPWNPQRVASAVPFPRPHSAYPSWVPA
jgi:hypothetical protein